MAKRHLPNASAHNPARPSLGRKAKRTFFLAGAAPSALIINTLKLHDPVIYVKCK